MGLTKAEKEKFQEILKNAIKVYEEDYTATLDGISEKFGVSKSAIYRYVKKHNIVKATKYTNEDLDKLLELYVQDNTRSLSKLGEPYGIPYTALSKRAKELGIEVHHGIEIPLDQEKLKLAIQYYQNGLTYEQAAKKAGIGANRFRYYMRDNGLLRKSYKCQTNKTFDINFFKEINTEEKAYWFGFIMADGWINISNSRSKFGLELQESDEDQLVAFNKSINGNIEIKHRSKERFGITSHMCYISITDQIFCQHLIDKGCVPNKTEYGEILYDIPFELKPAFLRGYIDGDGGIHKSPIHYETKISVKNDKMLNYLIKLISDISGVIPKVIFEKNHIGSSYKIYISGKENFFTVMDIVYKDATIYMDRKYQKYLAKFKGRPQSKDIEG